MRRRWLILTAVLCAMLVMTTLFASVKPGKVVWVSERDGERLVQRRSLFFISSIRREADPSLHISSELRALLARAKLHPIPDLEKQIGRAERQPLTNLQWHYSLSATTSKSMKDVVDFFARQIKVTGHSSTPGYVESLNGTCSDGRSELDLTVRPEGALTQVDFGLSVPK